MIAFATLFLGLVVGAGPVDLLVSEGVAVVEVTFDGRPAATLASPPWTFRLDLGRHLLPHVLEAIARAPDGRELGRQRQWINLPRDLAEASLLVEAGVGGEGATARLSWSSVAGSEPQAVSVTLDGRALPVADPRRFELPPLDPRQLHFLRAELDFAGDLTSVAEATFGGTYTDQVRAEMTAVPLLLDRRSLSPGELADLLVSGDGAAPILALEEGPAEIVAVVAAEATPAIDAMRPHLPSVLAYNRFFASTQNAAATTRALIPLKDEQRLRFLAASAEVRREGGQSYNLFPASREYDARDGGLLWLLQHRRPAVGQAGRQRLADAVAVAGMTAAGRNRRRAVVLLTTPHAADASDHAAASVRDYLAALRVPLAVWSVGGAPPGEGREPEEPVLPGWGAAADVSTLPRLERRMRELQRLLARQRIAWIAGTHLPQAVALAPGASPEARLVR